MDQGYLHCCAMLVFKSWNRNYLEEKCGHSDESVLVTATKLGYVVVTKDDRIERDEIESIIATCARVIILTDKTGGVANFAASLICGNDAYEQILRSNPNGPLVIRIGRSGSVSKLRGAEEMMKRCQNQISQRIARSKKIEVVHMRLAAASQQGVQEAK